MPRQIKTGPFLEKRFSDYLRRHQQFSSCRKLQHPIPPQHLIFFVPERHGFSQQGSSMILRRSCLVQSDAVSQDDDSGILSPIFSSTCSFVMGEITMSITVLKRSFLLSKWNGLPILARATHSLARDRAPSAPGTKTMPETRPVRSPPSSAPTGPRV